jgi:hypothetical protein
MGLPRGRTGFWDYDIEHLEFALVPPLPKYWRDIPEKDFSLKEDARRRE